MFFGPLSDSVGRKPAIYAGLLLFIIGCLMSILATDFTVMLTGRVLQGLGAAGPRSVIVALVRDQYEGRAMARVMSLVMAVFIMVPALAPGIGQIILAIAHWRAIFGFMLAVAAVSLVWFALRQPETLAPERRARFSPGRIPLAARETCTSRIAFGYTLASGLIFGAFVGYLNSAQQILPPRPPRRGSCWGFARLNTGSTDVEPHRSACLIRPAGPWPVTPEHQARVPCAMPGSAR